MPPVRAARVQRSARRSTAPRVRQERGVRTEEAIVGATLRLLAIRGIQGTSLDLVADEVGIAKSSILWHFGSKEGLLLRVAEHAFEAIARGPAQRILALPTIEEREAAMWAFFAETVRERPAMRRLVLYLIFECTEGRPELRARLQQLYRAARELVAEGLRGVVPQADRRRRLAAISVAALDGLFLQWLLDPAAIDLEGLHREMRALTARAMGRRKESDA
jgi:AcrR family transcriptional regulator